VRTDEGQIQCHLCAFSFLFRASPHKNVHSFSIRSCLNGSSVSVLISGLSYISFYNSFFLNYYFAPGEYLKFHSYLNNQNSTLAVYQSKKRMRGKVTCEE
jgi:hypothetical protein